MLSRPHFDGAKFAVALILLSTSVLPVYAGAEEKPKSGTPTTVDINLDRGVTVALPHSARELVPTAFRTADGKSGWVVRIPGGRPIATPAYDGGLLFVGGGYGSHEFYAFHAETGELAWKIQTKDDGPTAAVVDGDYVAFNTESCTVIVVDKQTGKVVWQEWLGDPMMSQPTIAQGRLFIAYPAGPKKAASSLGHRLLAADLKSGKHLWEQPISGDVISAPVFADGVVYITCFDGTSFAFRAVDGTLIWKKEHAATAAPLIVNGEVVVTRREQSGKDIQEGMALLDPRKGEQKNRQLLAMSKADYLARGNHGGMALDKKAQEHLDAGVGFSSAPASASLSKAEANVGISSVAGAWAYQGSRAAYNQGQVVNAQGRFLNSIRASDGTQGWRAEAHGTKVQDGTQVFSPPSVGKKDLYLTSSLGHILSVGQQDGRVKFSYSFGTPMVFQPALARGNIYAGTTQGMLVCLKTGEGDADGWFAWGGNAQHNRN